MTSFRVQASWTKMISLGAS